jgi:uncharacterized membrane protein YeiB
MNEVIENILNYLVANYAWYLVVMMTLIIAITNTLLMFVKKPLKKLTALIKVEKLRKLANKVFILFAFCFSALAWWGLSFLSAKYFPFDAVNVLLTGAFSIVIYAFGDGIVTKSQAAQLVDNVKEIAEDGKVDGNDKTATKEFWDKVK